MLFDHWDLVLTGERIRLTPFTEADQEPYGILALGEETYRDFVESAAALGKPTAVLKKRDGDEVHIIRSLDSDAFQGWVVLQKDEEGKPDIGIHLVPEIRYQGYGPEAVRLYLNWLYKTEGTGRVYARISADNVPSQRAFAKLGAVLIRTGPYEEHLSLLKELHGEDAEDLHPVMFRYYYIDLPVEG